MSYLFESTTGDGLIIYTYKNQIHMRKKHNDQIGKINVLAYDYMHSFSAIVFSNTIYYSYIDSSSNYILRRISDNIILYMIEKITIDSLLPPQLVAFDHKLFICYKDLTSHNPTLKCIPPFHPEIKIDFSSINYFNKQIEIYTSKKNLYIEVSDNHSTNLYQLNSNFQIIELEATENIFSQEIQELKLLLNEKENEITTLHQTLESAKHQYNELMSVANQYKQEAIKWCSKFSS